MTDIDVTAKSKWRLTEHDVGKHPFMTLFEGDRMVGSFCLEGSKADAEMILGAIQATAQQAAEIAELRDVIDSIYQYANDTLSGRVDGPDDRDWQRAAVVELRKRARPHSTIRSAIDAQKKLTALAREGEG